MNAQLATGRTRRSNAWAFALACSGALLLCNAAPAEVVTLKNGQVLSGSIRSESDTMLTLTRHGQNIAIKKEDIESVDRKDTTYYEEEYQSAVEKEDKTRVRRLLEMMKVHPEEAVRRKAQDLQGFFENGGKEPDWPTGMDLQKATLDQLRDRFHKAVDRLRWDEAIEIGREVLKRETPPVLFYAQLLEACKQTKRDTAALLLDTERLYYYGAEDGSLASQIYLAAAFEDRILKLWNEQKPDRTDAEIHVCLLARGMALHSQAIHDAPEERRTEVERAFRDMTTTDDWDFAARRVSNDLEMLMFNGASRMRPELVPVVRYFALLKEKEILGSRKSDPLLDGPVSEARAAYIYTVSEVIPLPKEKLWSSARDLALAREQKSPRVSDIMQEVFDYTPAKKHSDLAMAYEALLVEESLTNRDRGEGLRKALTIVAKRRCGGEFDEQRTWQALRALATLDKGEERPGQPVELTVSDIMTAAFSVVSPYEKEKVCLMYEKNLIDAANRREAGDGLGEALRTAAARRVADTSTAEEKWACFAALAQMNRNAASTSSPGGDPSVSEVLEAAFSVAAPGDQPRVAVAFEDRVVEAAATERGAALQQAVRHVAAHRGQELTDATGSWRAFDALARVQGAAAGLDSAPPTVSQTFDAAFSVVPARSAGTLTMLFEDTIENAVRQKLDKGSGLLRAVETLSRARLEDPLSEPMTVWRATEAHAQFLYGDEAKADDTLALLDEHSRASTDLRIQAMNVATAYYSTNVVDPVYLAYRERWARGIGDQIDKWIAATSSSSATPPVTAKVSSALIAQSETLSQALQRQAAHKTYLVSLDDYERRLKERFKIGRNVVTDDTVPVLVQSFNDYWSGTTSPASHQRVLAMIEAIFDEQTRLKMLQSGLRLDAGSGKAEEAAARPQ